MSETSAATGAGPTASANRMAITIFVTVAALMQSLDTTIANIALPYMQGSVSASQDEIEWVLTSYIVAAAIMTPAAGFLTGRFGIKRVFLVSVAGFTAASMLCGLSQSLVQIVLFRLLQGVFGAALIPLSQSVLMNIYPRERQGSVMALWTMSIMAGPVLGPVLGGWLTQAFSWRYVFFINLPVGIAAFLGMRAFLPNIAGNAAAKLDWFGFGALSLAIAAFQLFIDRGQELDWFNSKEILLEAVVAAGALYLFIVHTFTAKAPFVRPSLFKDRNFTAGAVFGIIVGLTYYSSLALQPPFLQNLMQYPVVTAGLTLGPRGIGTIGSMMVMGRLVGKVDTRLLIAIGLGVTAWTFYLMSGWTPAVSQGTIIGIGVIQGVGLGFISVPLNVATLTTLSAEARPEGAGLATLLRNMGSSVGISTVTTLLTRNTQVNHATIGAQVTAVNRGFSDPDIARFWNPLTAAGRTALDAVITRQAQIIAYMDDFKLLMFATLAVLPLLVVFTKPRGAPAPEHAMAVE